MYHKKFSSSNSPIKSIQEQARFLYYYVGLITFLFFAITLSGYSQAIKSNSNTSLENIDVLKSDSLLQNTNILLWTPAQRLDAFRRIESILPTAKIKTGDSCRELQKATPLEFNLQKDSKSISLDEFMDIQKNVGIVILHNGKIRLEKYKNGMDKDTKWISFSVTKSISSTLLAAAIADGFVKSIDDPVTNYIPELVGSGYDGVSIRQVLTMSSGVAWDENYTNPESDVSKFQNVIPELGQDPTVAYMQTLKREVDPGIRFNYNTGETNLIGVLVANATGKKLSQYLSQKIWASFGMEHEANWILNTGISEHGGCCISATMRDYARFGQFVLEEMSTDNPSVVPKGWFIEAGKKQISFEDESGGYGYQWWVSNEDSFSAIGIFGQQIFIDPSRNLVIATSSNWDTAVSKKHSELRNIFNKQIQNAIDREKLIEQSIKNKD